jgi:dimethylargininase
MLALTHLPSPFLDQGQRTHVRRETVDFHLALRQHADYCQMLRDCGAEVFTLNVNCDEPDSTFIEDTAIVLDEIAVLASMGAIARRKEPAQIEQELRKYRNIERVNPPATLEGGDVLRVGRNLLVGLSARTNRAGVQALKSIVERHGYRVLPVRVTGCLHLKTACTALPDGSLLVNPAWVDVEALKPFEQIPLPAEEPLAANTLLINGKVCMPAAYPLTADMLRSRGFDVRTISLSEFAKVEGSVTCLSLLVNQ